MSITGIKENKEILTFLLKDVDVSVANALRRTLLMDIESWALGEIVLKKNKTPFIDEFLTDRIGLIPINQKEVKKESPTAFKLSAKGEINNTITVYSKDLKASDNKKYFPDNIMITKLKGNKNTIEEIEAEAKLVRGTSKINSKWAVLTVCGYAIDEHGFKFTVEAREVQSPKKSVKDAFDVLTKRLKDLKENIEKNNEKKVKIDKVNNKYFVYLYQEGHTIGNLLSSHIQNKFKDIPFVAYEVPHPLEETVLITLVGINPVEAINKSINDLVKLFEKIRGVF